MNAAEVDYLVVGGLAVVLHGYVRATTDVDLIVRLDRENALKAIRALTNLGLKPRAPVEANLFADGPVREQWIREKGLTVFSMFHPTKPFMSVDLFVEYPFSEDELWKDSEIKELQGEPVRVCSLDILLKLKRQSGRPLDIVDVNTLERIRSEK